MPTRKVQYRLTKLVKDLDDRNFRYKPKERKPFEWFFYTEAQTNELEDYIHLVRELVDEVERRHGIDIEEYRRGQPPKSAYDKAKVLLLQQYFQASNRNAESLVRLFDTKLDIKARLTYKDIERAYSMPDVQLILLTVFRMTNEPIADKETRFSIDGTGMPTSIKQNYQNDKDDGKKKAAYDMLIGMVGAEHKMFSAFKVTGAGSECPFLVPLLNQTAGMFGLVDVVCGDKAYLSRENCDAIAELGAKPRIHPKRNTRMNAQGSWAWNDMLTELVEETQQWLEEYHNRSSSEQAHSAKKRRFPRQLLKRRDDRRHAEIAARVVCYNIRRLGYLSYLPGIRVRWLWGG